jgi:pimeloyl-ACP methyl ester carboxylesterase
MRRTIICAVLLGLFVAACSGSSSARSTGFGLEGKTTQVTLAGQPDVLITAPHPTNKIVVYVHGAGETAATSLTDPEKKPTFKLLLAHGYSIVASNAHGLENWGDPASVQDYLNLIKWLRHRGLTRLYVIAQSMGGMDGTELLNHVRPVAWAGIYPACNLHSIYVRPGEMVKGIGTIGPFAGAIDSAYGTHVKAALRAESPVQFHGVRGMPMIFWSSPHDEVVPKVSNTDVCAAEARHEGAKVTVVSTTGNHGDKSNFDPARLLSVFSHGRD